MKIGKKLLVFIVALMLAVASAYAATTVYWTRTLPGQSFTVHGISAELFVPTAQAYHDKTVATGLTNEQVALSIYAENFYVLWLNMSYTTDCPSGLIVTVTGQYYAYYLSQSGSVPTISSVGSAFPMVFSNQTIDKTKLMYYAPTQNNDPKVGGLLMLTFAIDTEGVMLPGNYAVSYTFEMGHTD